MHSRFFSVNPYSSEPVYEQLKSQIRKAILWGSLRQGDQLPTIKDLASTLSLNPNTIARAFRELIIEGLLVGEPGVGTFVNNIKCEFLDTERRQHFCRLLNGCLREGRTMGLENDEMNNIWKEILDNFSKEDEHA